MRAPCSTRSPPEPPGNSGNLRHDVRKVEAGRHAHPLGRILVERHVITEQQLEKALADQRRDGGRLGDALAARGWASPLSIAAALSQQRRLDAEAEHGAPLGDAGSPGATGRSGWKPLGVLLVEKGLISEVQLKQALADQWERRGFLGEVLVARGWISEASLLSVLAEQLGVEPDVEMVARAYAATGPKADTAPAVSFEVREAEGGRWRTLHVGDSFLEATDYAFEEILTDREPEGLEIVRVEGAIRRVAWTFPRSGAPDEEQLLDVFGYPVTQWDAAPWLSKQDKPEQDNPDGHDEP